MDPVDVAADQRDHVGVGILVEGSDVLRCTPADPDDTDSEPSSHARY
jgi:hypothetical protein